MDKPLYIPPSKRTTGLKIWCSVCRTDVSGTCHQSGNSLKKCKNGWAHSFRVSGYKKGSKERVVIKLKTRNLEEARREAINIMAAIKTESEVRVLENKDKKPEVKPQLTMMEAMTMYLAHLSGERGPAHTLKVRTGNHVKDIERTMILFAKTMKKNGLNPEKLDISESIDQETVGIFHEFLLKTKKYSNRTYNHYMGNMRSLFNYLNKQEGMDIKNPFNTVQKRKAVTNIKTIEPEEFKKLLDVISLEQGEQILKTGEKKNHYHPFLKDAFKLGLLTGLRREELVSMRYCDIEEDGNGQAVVIASDNLKRNRIMNANETGDIKLTPVPVTPQLRRLLLEMGYQENKNSDKYILAPESNIERKTLMDIISKSFSHYGKLSGLSSDISFRHLRKTFATKMQIVLGDNSHLVTGHATQKILTDHYVNKTVIARVASDKDIFPELDLNEDEKKIEEIKNVREMKNKDKSLER